MLISKDEPINCIKCVHFFVTWDPSSPKGCRYFGFKTHLMPSQYVLQSSGSPCVAFQPKQTAKK